MRRLPDAMRRVGWTPVAFNGYSSWCFYPAERAKVEPFSGDPCCDGVCLVSETSEIDAAPINADLGTPTSPAPHRMDPYMARRIALAESPIARVLGTGRFPQIAPSIIATLTVLVVDEKTRARPLAGHVEPSKTRRAVQRVIDLNLPVSLRENGPGHASGNTARSRDPPCENARLWIVTEHFTETFSR